jgi:site-specific DNA-methyltransferase (adenine-specific)
MTPPREGGVLLPPSYYSDESVTIYHADCRDLLPLLEADVVLTDLPYGIGVDYGATYTDDADTLDALVVATMPAMQACAPVVALTCGIGNWWRYPEPTWVLCWHQSNAPTASGRWGFNQWQPVLVYGKDPYLVRLRGRRSDTVSVGASGRDLIAARKSDHPCPKPLGAWKKIMLRLSPDITDTFVDPFMGSGTTLVAAKYAGRKAIGIEVNEAYCEVAANRCTQNMLDFGGAA